MDERELTAEFSSCDDQIPFLPSLSFVSNIITYSAPDPSLPFPLLLSPQEDNFARGSLLNPYRFVFSPHGSKLIILFIINILSLLTDLYVSIAVGHISERLNTTKTQPTEIVKQGTKG